MFQWGKQEQFQTQHQHLTSSSGDRGSCVSRNIKSYDRDFGVFSTQQWNFISLNICFNLSVFALPYTKIKS